MQLFSFQYDTVIKLSYVRSIAAMLVRTSAYSLYSIYL